MKRIFLVGRSTCRLRAVWLVVGVRAPIAGPFTLCGVVTGLRR
ncbi:MAG: hypothetical protein ACRENP_00380 [Longimicrobiales bacterium]